jgi:hypothetical protein
MSPFVEECRREWKRLGVPELLAEEMATELESDLAEAEADGVSAVEMLGESDPRRFATTWASERGLVSEPAPQKRRRRIWPWILVGLLLLVLLPTWLALQSFGSGHATGGPPFRVLTPTDPRVRATVPNVVGMRACKAERIALAAGLIVRGVPKRRCNARVIFQQPAPGSIVRALAPRNTVKLRLGRG